LRSIHNIPSHCSALPSFALRRQLCEGTLVFAAGGESARTVQCWLMRFFGPQAALQSVRTSQVDFAEGLPTIDLVSDVVIRAGQQLSLFGNGGILRVGKSQVQSDRRLQGTSGLKTRPVREK
jgi:hypothetical protein